MAGMLGEWLPVALIATAYELQRIPSLNAGRVFEQDILLRRIWSLRAGRKSEAVRTCVKKLRQKLGDNGANPTYILNERGVVYRMASPNEA